MKRLLTLSLVVIAIIYFPGLNFRVNNTLVMDDTDPSFSELDDVDGQADIASIHVGTQLHLAFSFIDHLALEEEGRMCRWMHTPGQMTTVTYKWGDQLQNPSNPWRVAFQTSINNWNAISSKIRFQYNSNGKVTINTVSDPNAWWDGLTSVVCTSPDWEAISAVVLANTWGKEGISPNRRRTITGHEMGHALGLAHTATRRPSIMISGTRYYPEIALPQVPDIELVNYLYP